MDTRFFCNFEFLRYVWSRFLSLLVCFMQLCLYDQFFICLKLNPNSSAISGRRNNSDILLKLLLCGNISGSAMG